jgi:predicted  nucleic acid-binding Zn-ribbon protein
MKKGNKYPIRQVSITNMTNFLNLLAGKTFRSKEIVALSKEYHIRANFLSYAKAINYCKKQPDGSYYFLDRLFDPIHGKLLIETSNKYNNEVNAKKKLIKEKTHLQESITDELKEELNNNFEIENSIKVIEELKQLINELYEEIDDLNLRNKELEKNQENEYRTNLIQQYEGDIDFLEKEKKELQEENNSLKENIKHLKYIIYNAKEVDKSHEKNNEKSLLIKELLCQYLMDDCEISTEINNKKQVENKTNFNPFDAPVIEREYNKFYTDEE